MRFAATLTVFAVLAVVSPASSAGVEKYNLESTEFKAGETLPKSATCDGEGKSPVLHWTASSSVAAKSYALIVDDPDAPSGTFTHWVLFNIPGATSVLQRGVSDIGVPGRNDFNKNAYGPACPPQGHGMHRYFFRLWALDVDKVPLGVGATRTKVEDAMRGHIIGRAELVGTYERK